jgi:hypothetical protein
MKFWDGMLYSKNNTETETNVQFQFPVTLAIEKGKWENIGGYL